MMLKQTSDNTGQWKTNAERVQGRESSRSLNGLGLRGVTRISWRGAVGTSLDLVGTVRDPGRTARRVYMEVK